MFIAKITLIIVLGCAGCKPSAYNTANGDGSESSVVSPSVTPRTLGVLKTSRVRLEYFSLTLPESLVKVPTITTNSTDWVFRDDEMTVAFESSMYAPKLLNCGDLDFREFEQTIDGERCKIVTLEFRDTSNHVEPWKKYSVMARFEQSDRVTNDLNIYIYFGSAENQRVAKDIIESIKFNN